MFDNYSPIQEIHKVYCEGVTVKEVVLSYLSRIAEIDSCEDGLKSVIEVNPDALFIAEMLDGRKNEINELPLYGIPVLLKDNINTYDRMHTTSGSVALANNYAPFDAPIVDRLRRAGAVILGKANMTEFANYMTRDGMPTGYSSRGGQVLNPYNRKEHPGGSSAGSGVAVAAGLCTLSVGTETSGSIISPAGRNGIVGIKPTLGLVGRSGIIPISSTHDTAGPMARNVRDAAIMLSVIAGYDHDDAATHVRKHDDFVDYTQYLKSNRLDGVRIGINRPKSTEAFHVPEISDERKAAFDHLCGLLSDTGAVLVDSIQMDYMFEMMRTMNNEFKSCLNYYLSTCQSKPKTLKDIIKYNQDNAAVALKYGQSILLGAENHTSGAMIEPAYIEGLIEREKTITELDRIFDENRIDVMLNTMFTNIAPFTGFPSMSIPIDQSRSDNIPLDSYWIARRFDEASLLKVCYAVEQILGLKLRPTL